SFAGSVATADRLVRTMIGLGEVPMKDVIKMMTATPARILNVGHKKGELAVGKDADIVIFDDAIEIQTTIVNGRIVYARNKIDDSEKLHGNKNSMS
ncbi:MAG TPA: amidohydrolase family protein, partial [Chitinophagaceae bacterium]|nr:amidohydrolase family protein [Chitinophagaceae bacterium]